MYTFSIKRIVLQPLLVLPNASKFGWYYESCPGCKSSNRSLGEKIECPCGIKDVEPLTKFKIEVEVEVEFDDHKGNFLFWNKECIAFTKMSTKELRQLMKAARENNPKIWSAHLDILLNKDMAFCIKYQSFYQKYSVVTILNEKNIYNKLKDYLTPNEMTLSSEVSSSAQPSSSANHDWSPSSSSCSTPAKRVVVSSLVNDLI
ncbi:hypothetical protein RYX36_012216 [Vicia faba]